MERAGKPRHRLHNPRGEGERVGSERINTPAWRPVDTLHCPFGETGERSGGRESTFPALLLDQSPIGRARETCENSPSSDKKNRKKLRYDKINPDPYAKRT